MSRLLRIVAPIALAVSVSACSISGLLGGGVDVPPTLLTLTPEAPPVAYARTAAAGEAVTVEVPVIAKELSTVRVPVQVTPTDVAYVEDVRWVDTPDRLFKDLLGETIRRTTSRVVLDANQAALDPGVVISGQLRRFGFDAATGSVVVTYDATQSRAGGTQVTTRRFEASVPASADASIGPALNRAANQVALEAAAWIGG